MANERPPVLMASLHDIRHFVALLRGVNFNNRATITATKQGFTVKVEEARTLTGTAFIFSEIFDEYVYTPENPKDNEGLSQSSSSSEDTENIAFEVPLNTLTDCLNVFGTAGLSSPSGSLGNAKRWRRTGEASDQESEHDAGGERAGRGRRMEPLFTSEKHTGMRMTYAGSGYPLTVLLAEDASGPTTTCRITTYEPEPQLELDFDNSRLVLKIILKSSWLRDALSELDPSCDKLTLIGNPPETDPTTGKQKRSTTKPKLRIKSGGNFGTTEMDYPNDRDVLETFECLRSVSYSYRFSHISRTLRALQSSTKTSLRIDEEGLLSLQFLMPSPKPKGPDGEVVQAFIEFRCLALDDELV